MPHIIVKLWPGKSEEQKNRVTDLIVKDVMEALGSSLDSISLSIEEVHPDDWSEQVYKPEVVGEGVKLYKEPGYKM